MPSLLEAGRNIAANWLSGSRQDPSAVIKALQDPAMRARLAQVVKQELEQLTGQTIGGYATLPALLALLSSFFTDKPMIPILLGLAGLGIAHFFPEVREHVNVFKWFPEKKPEPPAAGTGSAGGTGGTGG